MNHCYLSLGSNLNNPRAQLIRAINRLKTNNRITVTKIAPFYANKAVGRKTQPQFFNTVLEIYTSLDPFALLNTCLDIEKQQGRQRQLKWGARTLDIDILFYNDWTINHSRLIVPHPRLFQRDFVLVPLSNLLGE